MMKLPARFLVLITTLSLPVAPAWPGECQELHDSLALRYERALEAPAQAESGTQALNALEDDVFAALETCPDGYDLLKLMGEIQISAGRAPIAVAYGNKLIDLEPERFGGHLLLGAALVTVGRTEQGLHHMARAEELAPDNLAIKLNLCGAHAAAGNAAQAVSYCETVAAGDDAALAGMAATLLERLR